jgi:chromosome segregation ATPase
VLDDTLKEKERIQASVDQLQAQLKDKEEQLAILSDVQGIKTALINAQLNIDNLNKELGKYNRDRAALQDANVSLTTRLQNTTKEYMRTMDELKSAQDQAARLSKGASPDKNKIDEINKIADEKNKELARQKEELDSLKASSQSLTANNRALEKKLKDLEYSRGIIAENTQNLQGEIDMREIPSKQLQATITFLRGELSRKEERIAELEDKFARQVAAGSRTEGTIGERKYKDTKADLDQLSGILIRKEIEMDSVKKDAMFAKEELIALQTKLSGMQDSRVNQEKLKDMEKQKLSWQSQLNQLQQELSKKNELVESLHKNIDYLTMQKGELDKEKRRSAETNMMYNNLKDQISQFSDAISLKEEEIENKRREILSLREELSSFKSRWAQLENDLAEAKENQKKIMGDLSAAVRINSLLQEKIRSAPEGQESAYPLFSSEDKKKADELKRKIEVILEPEKH